MKIDRLRILAGGIEATAGTAETLDATDAVTPAFNVTYNDQTQYNVRENDVGGKLQGRRGPLIAQIGFDFEAMGLGATGAVPDWSKYLLACGFDQSTATFTRTRVVASQKTVTLESWIDGHFRQIYGAAGTVQLLYNAGARSFFRFLFTGIAVEPDDGSQYTPTLVTTRPILGAATFTYNNGSPITMKTPSATLDFGCQVQPIESVGTAGYERFCVSDFNPTLQVEPYGEAQSVINYDADWTNNAERAVSLVLGSTANNTITMAASKASLNAPPGYGDRGRLLTRSLSLDFNDDAAPTIVFS